MATENTETETISDEPKRDSKARTASAAVFFNENKSIAGFGNSMRAVFTSVRELVENSLDASEKRGVTPEIKINLRRLERKELVELMGTNVIKTKDKRVDFIELSCRDNGVGVPRDLIPQLFGTVLAGTKYGAQQTRGRFGLGSKMVLLYAMSTLDLPIQITTRPEGEDVTYRVRLFINLEKNQPIIHSDEKFVEGDEEYFNDCGTEIKVSFTGSWNLAKLYVREYFRQLAIITPYADMLVDLPSDDGEDGHLIFQRVVDEMPKPPEVVKIHPWGTDISTFRREMMHATENNLIDFLVNNFMGVSKKAAIEFFEEVGVETDKKPQDLTSQEIRRIVHDGFTRALKESRDPSINVKDRIFSFKSPSGEALSPLGADRLRKGLEKELDPEFVQSITRDPKAYEGHPFVIEAAIGYGGGVNKAAQSKGVTIVDNRIIYRFANRIPLIFGAGSDLITNIANSINWSDYGLTRGTEPLAIAVSLVSTKIPFPETSKEYIDKVEEIGAEVRLTLMQLGRNLKRFLSRRRRRQRERKRKSQFERYAPRTVENLLRILEKENLWDPSTGVPAERIIAALASGKPRIGSSVVPLQTSVYQAPIWSLPQTRQLLQENGIYEMASFLRTSNEKLSKILKMSILEIDLIKRRTIAELDKAEEAPDLNTDVILSSDDEIRFHRRDDKEKLIDLPRLNKACNRRWIRNSYDYLVSTNRQLNKVQGLSIKLIEAERVHIIKSLFEEVENVDLADELSSLLDEGGLLGDFDSDIDKFTQDELPQDIIDNIGQEDVEVTETEKPETKEDGKLVITIQELFPPLDKLYDHPKLSKRKVNSVLEFLLETTHPSSPVDEKVLSTILIPSFKENLKGLVEENAEYGNIRVDVSSQEWIDGYLRNAFKRRKISTVNDVIDAKDELLLEIGELQRTLFYNLRDSLIPKKSKISVEDFNVEDAKQKIKHLKSAGITSLEKLAATTSAEIAENEELFAYVDMIIEESKDKIVEYLTVNNQLGTLELLKELDDEVEAEMDRLEINDSMQLLLLPLEEFDEKLHERIRDAKLQIGTNFEGFYKKHQSVLEKLDVVVLEELVFSANHFLQKEMTETDYEDFIEIIEYINEPVVLISSNLITSLDILLDAGVNSVGKFLIWPTEQLASIIDMPEEWINLIRGSFHVKDIKSARSEIRKPLDLASNILGKKDLEFLADLEIESVGEATTIAWGTTYPAIEGKWAKIKRINEILTKPLIDIEDDISGNKDKKNVANGLKDLNENDKIQTLLQFIKLPISALSNKISTKAKRTAIEKLATDLRSDSPSMISAESEYYQAAMTYLSVAKLKAPVVALSEFSVREIALLSEAGIKSIHQLLIMPDSDIADILSIGEKEVESKIANSTFNRQGTPIAKADERGNLHSIIQFDREGDTYFKNDEIAALSNAGYNTIESLYYMSDHRTFDVAVLDSTGSRVISWDTIRHFKKLLESPPVLITWKKIITEEREIKKDSDDNSEISLFASDKDKKAKKDDTEEAEEPQFETVEIEYYETFSSQELAILTESNIRRVIDFLTTPTDLLTDLLKWDGELTKERQTSVILQEAGIELSDLEIFREDHIEHLAEMGLITIEDLYFTAKKESWDSSTLAWQPIQTLKDILHLPLHHVVQEIGEDILELLVENDVKNILEFILTGDPILEQKTGLPAERFENLKYALDFGSLIEAFDKTVYFCPNITYWQCKKLHENGIERILDVVLTDEKKVGKILDMPVKDVRLFYEQISRSDIRRTESERGVLLKDINAFSRSDVRSVSQSGIFEMNSMDTIQEVLYQVSEETFQSENYLLDMVLNLQKVCNLNLAKIGDLNDADVKLLNNHGIQTIADALFIGYEDLNDLPKEFDDALKTVTKSVIDMQSFIAMGRLPAKTAMQEGEDDSNLLNTWLDTPEKLHRRTMRNIRSILSLPVRLTSLSKLTDDEVEGLGNMTIADIIMEYIPNEEHPHHQIQEKIKDTGMLVKLLREGSTPLTLLDFGATEFRTLIDAGINTIERIMMNDVKTLSNISGSTQKYWREIKDVFDPEVFNARLGDIGIPITVLPLETEDMDYLKNYGITYLDQISVYDNPKGILKELQDFLFAPLYFLAGNPGERELAENHDARSIIESVVALKQQGASPELVNEMINLAWQAYSKYLFETPSKSSKNSVETIQDLCKVYTYNPDDLTKRQTEYAELYLKSPLLLPLPSIDLKNIVIENRCVTIIDALTNPLVAGKIDAIRESILEGEDPVIYTQLDLPNVLLQDISKTVWKRIEKSNLSLQEVLSSPRTLEVFKSTKQKYLQDARDALRIPLTQILLEGNQPLTQIGDLNEYLRLTDIVFDLPNLYDQDQTIVERISSILGSEKLEVLSDLNLPENIVQASETAFGHSVNGFHDLWTTTWESYKILLKIDTKPAEELKKYIHTAFSPVSIILDIKPIEVWELWKEEIYTVSDLLLTPKADLGTTNYFTKKRVGQLKSSALETLEKTVEFSGKLSKDIAELLEIKDTSEVPIYLINHPNPHPLVVEEAGTATKKLQESLELAVMNSQFGSELDSKTIDLIHSEGIYRLIDFIVYPEELKVIPKKFRKVDDRFELLTDKVGTVDFLKINELNLPKLVTERFEGEEPVAKLLYEMTRSNDKQLVKAISIPLKYADLDEEIFASLEKEKIFSSYDLLHLSLGKISEIIEQPNPKVKKIIGAIDFASMFDQLENAPLQVNEIGSISKGGREILRNNDIYTAIDLFIPLPDGFNRIDTSYLTTLVQILESPVGYMIVHDKIERKTLDDLKNDHSTVRDLYANFFNLDKELQKILEKTSVDDLVSLKDAHRQFHDIEEIIIKDEKTLLNGGIFSFVHLSQFKAEELIEIGLAKTKAEVVSEILTSHWRNIVDFPAEAEKLAESLKLETIAEVLEAPEIQSIEISTPIKIKKELKLDQLLKKVPSVVEDAGVSSISQLIRSEECIEAFSDGDKDIINLIGILNSWVGNLPGITTKWVPKLEEAGIYRIWQYIVEDVNALSDICGTSIKAQETFKNKMKLDGFKTPEFNIPTLYKKDKALFEKYGFYSLKEIIMEGILDTYFDQIEEINDKISTYRDALSTPIYKLNSFWESDPEERREIAKSATSLQELAKFNLEKADSLIEDAVKENFREMHSLDKWINDEKELKDLSKQGINSVEEWMFFNTRGDIEPGSPSFVLFRSTLDAIPYFTIRHIVSGYHHNMTHISDLLLEDNKELAKKLRTTSKKVDDLLESIPDIGDDRPELPNLGLVSTSIVESMREGGIYSWAQILGNAVQEEIELIKGVTWNTVQSVREHANVPLWHSFEIRQLGVDKLRKLVDDGVTTIADVLVLGTKFEEFVGDHDEYLNILENISRANLKKGAASISIRLSESYKIRVKDIPAFEKEGILSPIDIIIGNVDVDKNSDLKDGIEDWQRLGEMDIEEINFPMKAIKEMRKLKIKKVQDAILAPDSVLREAGATNHQIRAFRKDLNRLKKGDKRIS